MKQNAAQAQLWYRELEKIIQHERLDNAGKREATYQLLQLLFTELTQRERLHFTTHFARIAYTAHKHSFDKRLQYYLHFSVVKRVKNSRITTWLCWATRLLQRSFGALARTYSPEHCGKFASQLAH